MSASEIVGAVLLALGTAVVVPCVLGVLLMDDALQRLHYVTPAATLSPVFIGAGAVVEEPSSWSKVVVVVVTLFMTNAVVAPATARALLVRTRGKWPPPADDRDTGPGAST